MKAFRDPVHNLIRFDRDEEKVILDLIDCTEFQRLRHIRQLGMSSFTYFGAEHTRLSHSIGVAYLVNRFIQRLDYFKDDIDKKRIADIKSNRLLALVAALLHDLGHGPFSHALEGITKIKHEKWSTEIITGNTEINKVLEGYKEAFSSEVAAVIKRTHHNKAIVKLLSSQLDADRVDYLLRDSLMTGAGYGGFDLEWLIHSLRLGEVNGRIEVGLDLDKGLSIAEDFVMARYYMYKNVYFHKTTRCAELMIKRVFDRLFELYKDGNSSIMPQELSKVIELKIIDDEILEAFLKLTDYKIWSYIDTWSSSSDPILSDYCNRLLKRNYFKLVNISEDDLFENMERIVNIAIDIKVDYKYLFLKDEPKSSAYKDTYITSKPDYSKSQDEAGDQGKETEELGVEEEASEQIFLFDRNGNAKELSQVSNIINTIRNNPITSFFLFVREDVKDIFLK